MEKHLVKAYAVFFVENEERMETVFFVDANGKKFSTTRKFSNSFDLPGTTWNLIESIPVAAEFIGSYYYPKSAKGVQ